MWTAGGGHHWGHLRDACAATLVISVLIVKEITEDTNLKGLAWDSNTQGIREGFESRDPRKAV